MARRPGGGVPGATQAGPGYGDGDIPPSTIAAKIVDNRSNAQARQQPESKELFSRLLQEYLKDPGVEESNLETNAKLVMVVAEAGLDPSQKHDPFSHDIRIEQASASLAVIRLTIERVPEVLLFCNEAAGAPLRLPLFLSLLSKIFTLLGQEHLDAIQDGLIELLETCLMAPRKRTVSCQTVESFLRVIDICIDDIVFELSRLAEAPTTPLPRLDVYLPSVQAISCVVPSLQQTIVIPRTAQVHFGSIWHASAAAVALAKVSYYARAKLSAPLGAANALTKSLGHCNQLCSNLAMLLGQRPDVQLERAVSLSCHAIKQIIMVRQPLCLMQSDILMILQSIDTILALHYLPKSSILQDRVAVLLATISEEGRRCTKLRRSIVEILLPRISELAEKDESFSRLHQDLQLTLCFVHREALSTTESAPLAKQLLPDTELKQVSFASEELQQMFKLMNVSHFADEGVEDSRPFKRRRTGDTTSQSHAPSQFEQAKSYICAKLGQAGRTDLSGIHEHALSRLQELSATDQESIFALLVELPCVADNAHLDQESYHSKPCRTCSSSSLDDRIMTPSKNGQAIAPILAKLIEWPGLHRAKRLRVLAMLAAQRVINHLDDHAFLDLAMSPLGQWCLKSVHSSLRELRIAAGHTLTAFLQPGIPPNIRRSNTVYAVNFLKALSERGVLKEQETLVIAWAQVGRVCGEEELNIVLVQLVEYLGDSHPMICAVAYDEIAGLAEHKKCSIEDLFRPFWHTIAVSVVKDLHSRPQKAQQLCELLGISVGRFLLQTQAETIPFLVLTRSIEILQRVATARNMDVRDICLQPPRHLALILAGLLLQNFPDPERSIMDILCAAAPEFQEADLPSLVQLEPIPIACEMLKVAGAQNLSKKAPTHQAIKTFIMIAERRPGQGKQSSKTGKLLAQFLDSHILGIMTHFSEIIDAPRDVHPLSEKVRSIRAITEMLLLSAADFQFTIAIPQMRACLQSALNEPDLCDDAFVAWTRLVMSVDKEDTENLIEYTFTLIVRYWNTFSPASQQRAHDLISQIIKDHNAEIKDKVLSLPSLSSIPLMSKYDTEFAKFKNAELPLRHFEAFARRCNDENALIVRQALLELSPYLEDNQKFIHDSVMAAQPNAVIDTLVRAILDASIRFLEGHIEISMLCAQCLGLIGSLDPNTVEATRTKKEVMALSNFDRVAEAVDFVAFFLENVLVKAFHSATNGRVQNYLAYAMQELLKHCEFKTALQRPRSSPPSPQYQRWLAMSESARSTLVPYFHTKYLIARPADPPGLREYPIFSPKITHATWVRDLVSDLLQRGKGENAKLFFPVLSRIIKGHDLSIPNFLLPFTVLNVILGGTETEVANIQKEMLSILDYDLSALEIQEQENVRHCSENVFQVLDYLSRWLQQKRKYINELRAAGSRGTVNSVDFDEVHEIAHISSVERILSTIPPGILARRAMECHSFDRALFHWEQYLRAEREKGRIEENSPDHEDILLRLQDTYVQIDEPDGIQGISAHLHILDPEQQILDHRINGRWAAAQSWYELELEDNPHDEKLQMDLLTCLSDSWQQDILLKYVQNLRHTGRPLIPQAWGLAAEAAWTMGQWDTLQDLMSSKPDSVPKGFSIGVASWLLALRQRKDEKELTRILSGLREDVVCSFSSTNTASLKVCSGRLFELHVLYELEKIAGPIGSDAKPNDKIVDILDTRLGMLGPFTANKQYLLAARFLDRSRLLILTFSSVAFTDKQLAAAWLKSARLARKENLINVAYDAIHHASKLDADSAMVEQCRLLWKDGNHKKAIQSLQGAIADNAFHSFDTVSTTELSMFSEDQQQKYENALLAKAQLLLAKWNDQAGQMGSKDLIPKYQAAVRNNPHWDKGHYYLGRYYNKMLESEKTLPLAKQSNSFKTGETAKLVIDNFTRSLGFGAKYYYQTVPKILTLWLDFGQEVYHEQMTGRCAYGQQIASHRADHLDLMHRQLRKYLERLSPYIFYTAFPQIISRIGHSHEDVWDLLGHLITKIASTYPQQALWSLLAVAKSTSKDKASRGQNLLSRLRHDSGKKAKHEVPAAQLRTLISQGLKLTEALLHACEASVDSRAVHVSLARDLHFNHKLAPCGLVVPIEKTMTAVLPTLVGAPNIRNHKPFPNGHITIEAFTDDVLVLSSLQRPRKLTVRGTDGQLYGLLCKPKDDLRKDQRLMEFNAMIDRSLKRDVEASRRQLYIKTYGVIPLNEECGTIEWVDGLKPMRDIIINSYKQKGVRIDYNEIRSLLQEACSNLPASVAVFNDKILPKFPAVLHEWFIEMFPEPETWHAARLRYARSCAVMSIVGHMLGLGDRHGENVLLESGSGGVFHVDFNCLFDKGLTFEKPEMVPFRLTHNMVDAFGPCGVEGPFRKSAEVTLKVLRQHEDTLMTILETFLYDPTADFLGNGKKKRSVPGVPETPQEVLDSVRGKLKGFMRDEKVPLSVEGYVDTLIQMARSPRNLTEMYIGWCAFF
ncbi:hypothetical protein NA57DRAFT_41563 [Rhizodiscina lignyota]|uniref:non-specific serine/threonine protein kinase n=1 Tax=Rhizodiscina lignyota TaxID=1504668 RepID=A0A9P4M421_9PEZI|nr:hypothetical protein NA57DRAFT_41563 [Rhizodiscina lignyota]